MDDITKLSKAQCKKIIEKYSNSTNAGVESYSLNPFNSHLDGLIGEHYLLKIQYKIEEHEKYSQFFVKILNGKNVLMFKLSKEILAYEKEAFYYQTFLPLAKSKNISFDGVPECYFCEPYTIVLQDLSLQSYRGTTKNKPLDLNHCKKCLEMIAKFHVAPILYEIARSKELGKSYRLTDDFGEILEDKVFTNEKTLASKYMLCSVMGIIRLIETAFDDIQNKKQFKNKLEDIYAEIISCQDLSMRFTSTILHGDLWSNNFLHKYNEDNEVIDSKMIDFQIIKYGPPVLDVLEFIFLNTRKQFRELHLEELLSYYYNYFSDLLVEQGLQPDQILPKEEFKETCTIFIIPAKIHAITDRSITLIPEEVFLKAAQTEESFSKFMFEERSEYIIEVFKQNQRFKDVISEDVYELVDLVSSEYS